ncbi:flavodoxin [Bacteroides acidifaciens]|uniref:flavodoxin n=1 Tax=Bacteroides acidifaciens TaxID=85831 RepID=UPI0023C8BF1F|nr:flavodoxin [Bacteroides acidifaciens]MDE6821394.1 aldo/keto reductase [Bacteroides acidifaciens]
MKMLISSLLFMSGLALSTGACSPTDEPVKTEEPTPVPDPEPNPDPTPDPQPTGGRALVVYFSCTNTTKGIADRIVEASDAATWRIEPEVAYTSEDLNYNNSSSRANREQNDPSARPAIKGKCENLADYDVVFLGYPIWWGKAPKVIFTFLESHDLAGKTVVPFCTSHSSGIGSSDTDLHRLATGAEWKQGRRFNGNESKETIENWIESMNLNFNNDTNAGVFDLSEGTNGNAPTVKLSSGYDMPILGLGTYSLHGATCVNSVKAALAAGFRKIDTAHMYDNEEEVGQGVRESGVPREEIFVATKLYPNQYSNPEAAIEECLRKLDIGYIDLMLLHHPGANDVKAYKAMEKYVAAGKIRSIGVSCYYVKEIDEFLPQVNIKPVLVQNEVHPYYQDTEVMEHLHDLGIVVEAWYPLGGRGHQKELLSDPVLSEIAAKHDKSVVQVILRWHLQRGVVAIPGSSNPDHIRENISVFDFSLTDDEMARIAALDRNEKHDWY